MGLPLFWLMVFLCQGAWSSLGHSQSQGLPEVVIPLKITDSESTMRSSNWISYSLKFEGQRHVVHLKLIKYLMARNMPLFTYTDQGALLEDYPFIQDNCYYHGYMDGDPKSQVSLNRCFGGFQGFLQKDNTVYQIEPKINSTAFEHLVYKLVSEEKAMPARRCGFADADSECQFKMTKVDHFPTARQSGISAWWTHKRYYKLGLVVNNDLYKDYQSNVVSINNAIMAIINTLHGYFQQLDLSVSVSGIEIWTDKNHVPYVNDDQYLRVYCDWMERSYSLRVVHNSANLLSKLSKDTTLYNVYIRVSCSDSYKCGYVQHRNSYTAPRTAVVLAQSVGLQIGIKVDEDHCVCGQNDCIMTFQTTTAHSFSNCSYASYYESDTECLFDVPKELRTQRCGNGVVDEGEACDCGTAADCAQDTCCETDCSLVPGAQCASGLCCRSCKFLPTGSECRKSVNECDLPEWCNGSSAQCPDDVYVQGGVPCGAGGHCYAKRCNSREEQCRGLFGKQARSARPSCYRDANVRGDRFGNCGLDVASYTACAVRDALCGRLQCEDVRQLPALHNHTTLVATNISGTVCWGLDFHWGAGLAGSGEVRDGTECGPQRICVERRCVPLSHFTSRCSPEQCSRRGTCNNRHHCHCRPPWRPPFCYVAGVGGSVDSGPPPGSLSAEPDQDDALGFQPPDVTHTHLCFYLLLLRFLLFLLIFLAVLLRALF